VARADCVASGSLPSGLAFVAASDPQLPLWLYSCAAPRYFRESTFYLLGCGWVATQTRAYPLARNKTSSLTGGWTTRERRGGDARASHYLQL